MMAWAHVLRGRGAGGAVMVQALALMPPLAVTLWLGGGPAVLVLGVALAVVLGWDLVFALVRQQPFVPLGVTTAAIVALFVPPDMPIWHLVVALTLGTVIGERVFGGRGFGFLSPAAVTLAFALVSLPDLSLVVPGPALALACLPGAALLLVMGLISLPVVLAFSAVLALALQVTTLAGGTAVLIICAAPLIFVICEPTAAAVTNAGRILYGALAGYLTWVFSGFGTQPPPLEALVFAALLASLFAPMLDHLVVSAHLWRRRQRHG